MRVSLLLPLLLLAAVGPCPGQLSPEKIREIEAIITSEMSGQRIPGMTIAVLDDKGAIWTNGYGLSDVENFVPVKSATVFRTASIAKPITAVAVMQLVEAGKIELDTPIDRYLPGFATKPYKITTRQLLGHLGGIRHYRDGAEASSTRHYASLMEALAAFQDDDLANEPGTKMTYTTYGYVVLGALIEAASGSRYIDYLREHVLRPAGMEATTEDDVYALIPNRSRGYARTPDGRLINCALHDTSGKISGGGLVSTASDLARFVQALDSGKLLKPDTLQQMFLSQKTSGGQLTSYGFGWGISDYMGRQRIDHGGGQAGVSTGLYYLPKEHKAVALMFNLQGVDVSKVAQRILSTVLQ